MTILDLTDAQVAELPEMCLAGEMAADELRFWRACCAAPWEYGDGACGGFICYHAKPADNTGPPYTEIPDDGREPVILGVAEEDRIAICHSRNTAALRAAAIYWNEKKTESHAAYTRQLEQGLSTGDEWTGWSDLAEANQNLSAIAKAYAEMNR